MDKFKGSMDAVDVTTQLRHCFSTELPDARIVGVPVADGGEGTLAAALDAGFDRTEVKVTDPLGHSIDSAIAVRGDLAVVELASASGIGLLPNGAMDPLRATSRGTGELILAALDARCSRIILAVGGSACTDGGAGMLQALGARLVDAEGEELCQGGGSLLELAHADLAGLDPRLRDTHILLASDVDNPLLGPHGTVEVFAAQKGATEVQKGLLEAGLERWAAAIDQFAATLPGAGAAGGVGFAALAVLKAKRRPGIDVVSDLVGLQDHLEAADLVVTGEGSLDKQTLLGKAVIGVVHAAQEIGVPTVVICGQNKLTEHQIQGIGIARVYSLQDVDSDLYNCIARPGPLLCEVVRNLVADGLVRTRR